MLPSAAFASFASSIGLAWLMFAVAALHFLILGVPIFALLRRKRLANLLTSVLAGATVGGVPAAALLFPVSGRYKDASYWSGGVAHMINGVPTSAGWESYSMLVLQLSAFGAMVGLAFAVTLMALARREA
jgi:hypothetical protein